MLTTSATANLTQGDTTPVWPTVIVHCHDSDFAGTGGVSTLEYQTNDKLTVCRIC